MACRPFSTCQVILQTLDGPNVIVMTFRVTDKGNGVCKGPVVEETCPEVSGSFEIAPQALSLELAWHTPFKQPQANSFSSLTGLGRAPVQGAEESLEY